MAPYSICSVHESARRYCTEYTNLMSWKTGAFTTVGFRAWETVRHNDVRIKKADGMIEKNNCSNGMLKSNASEFSWSKPPAPEAKGMSKITLR